MADEENVRKEVWEGKIPVCFTLADEEVGYSRTGERSSPDPAYMMLPRVSYFPMVYEKLEKLFSRSVDVDEKEKELWLSAEDVPLRWDHPVGVLYDLYGRGGRLPWNVTVHFTNFPDGELLHCQGKEAVQSHYHARIKEADCLKHRSEIIQSLTPDEFGKLWESFRQNNFMDFWSVNKKMMLNMRSEAENFKHIPFCIYREGAQVFQCLQASVAESRDQKLSDLIGIYRQSHAWVDDYVVLIHGIELPHESPLQWLSENFSYPDNFLHICVVMKQAPSPAS